jgi:protein SCO1/2
MQTDPWPTDPSAGRHLMYRIAAFVGLILLVVIAGAVYLWNGTVLAPSAETGAASTRPTMTQFTLTERSGETFHSQDLQGRVWVGSFFFTKCASNCRMLNMHISTLMREFGPRGVRFISISCDPENDTLDALSHYADMFNADERQWLFLRGEMEYVQKIGSDMMGVGVDRQTHFDQLIVFAANGERQGIYRTNVPSELARVSKVLDRLLTESPAEENAETNE